MKVFTKRRLIALLGAANLLSISTGVFASAFQLWEQDAASIGLYHAGYAAWANDASTAFYNPAGMTLIKNQQLVVAGVGVMTDFKFDGNVTVNTIKAGKAALPTDAQGGNFSFIPAIHYVAPLADHATFGFSIDVPFGLKTNYGQGTPLRYVATLTSANVIDISPSLAAQVTDKTSVGVGFDIQKMTAEFDQVGTFAGQNLPSQNKLSDTGYGYHLGALYQFTPTARVGISYHSQVAHHLTGSSKLTFSPLLSKFFGPQLYSNNAYVNLKLPAYTALSGYYLIHPKFAVMASAIYTQWNTFQFLTLNNFAAIVIPLKASTTVQVTVPEHYRNTWNLSIGGEYYATSDITLRAGVGYDETPVSNAYRNVQLPDNNRYVIALGGHYQATKSVGVDVGWSHFFLEKAHVNPPPLALGAVVVTSNGSVEGGADVFGAQVTWNM